MNKECLQCQINSLEKRIDKFEISTEKREELFSGLEKYISGEEIPDIPSDVINNEEVPF